MSPFEFFVRRQVATTLLAVGLLALGLAAFLRLPVASMPAVDVPTIRVSATRPGASPEVMAASVAAPLERRLSAIAGVIDISSTSVQGFTSISVRFSLRRPLDRAAHDVQAAINAALTDLPSDLSGAPTFRKAMPWPQAFMVLALTSRTLGPGEMFDAADSVIAQRIAQVPGVADVTVSGGAQPAVRIEFDPATIAAAGLSVDQIRTAIAEANALGPTGAIEGRNQREIIALSGQLATAADYANLMLRTGNGVIIRLPDVATVTDGLRNARAAGLYDGRPALIVNITRAANANVVETVDRIRALLPELRRWLPADLDVEIMADRTQTIRASLAEMGFTLGLSILLVMLIVYLFLGRLTPTIAAGVAIPLSFAGAFISMWALGFSINNLTLMALIIAVGFVVDDAIIVIESILERQRGGAAPLDAAVAGVRQISFTVVAVSMSLVAAFLPLLFMDGVVGRYFLEFALTICFAIIASMVIALTLTPMLCGHHLKLREPGPVQRVADSIMARITALYLKTLDMALDRLWLSLLVTAAAAALSIQMFQAMPKGQLPEDDSGLLWGWSVGAPDVSFDALRQMQTRAEAVIRQDRDVAHVASFLGSSGAWATSNNGSFFVVLKPRAERKDTARRIARRLADEAAFIPGLSVYFGPIQEVRFARQPGGRSDYEITLWGGNLEQLRELAPRVAARLRSVPGLTDVSTDEESGGAQIAVTIDREMATRLGLPVEAISAALNNAFSQRQIATVFGARNQYRAILSVRADHGGGLDDLGRTFVTATLGAQIPLASVASFALKPAPLSVSHQRSFATVTINFGVAPDRTVAAVTPALRQAMADMRLPDGINAAFAGDAELVEQAGAQQAFLILGAVIAIYLLLGILYENAFHPLTILSTAPSAGLGALLSLKLAGLELTFVALVGIILLIGIVKKNGIMLVDRALEQQRSHGAAPREAIRAAARERLRPILMTTFAAMLGALPLAFGEGPGSEIRRPLGLTILGGLCLSQLLTLYTLPTIFVAISKLERALLSALARPAPSPRS
jgi:multidrug efflux pump